MKDRFGNRYKLYLTYIFICIGIGWVTKVNVPRPPQVPPPPQRPQEPPPPPPPPPAEPCGDKRSSPKPRVFLC